MLTLFCTNGVLQKNCNIIEITRNLSVCPELMIYSYFIIWLKLCIQCKTHDRHILSPNNFVTFTEKSKLFYLVLCSCWVFRVSFPWIVKQNWLVREFNRPWHVFLQSYLPLFLDKHLNWCQQFKRLFPYLFSSSPA